MIDPGFSAPEWATVFFVMPMIITALIVSSIVGGLAAAGKSVHHGVKTGDWMWDDPATHGGFAVGAVPAIGPLLEAGVHEAAGRDPDWGSAATGAGISTVGIAAGGAGSAVAPVAQPAVAAGTAAIEVADDVIAPVAMEAFNEGATQGVTKVATEVATEGVKEGASSILKDVLGAVESGWDGLHQGAGWVGENISQPIGKALTSPDRFLTPLIGKTPAGMVGGGLRGAAQGAISDYKNPLRGMATGIAGGVTSSALSGALGGVLPKRVDVADHVTRNPAFSASNPLNDSSAGANPDIIGNSLRPENVNVSGRFGPSRGMQAANAALIGGSRLASGMASSSVGRAMTPQATQPNSFRPRNAAEAYGQRSPRQRNGRYQGQSAFHNRKYI